MMRSLILLEYLERIHPIFKSINTKIKDFRDFHFVLIVFILGLFMRFIHWIYFGNDIISFPVDGERSSYYLALKDHFFEYIYYYHTKPIGIPIFDYLSVSIFGSIEKGHFLLVSLLDSLAPAFILAVLLGLNLPRIYSLAIVSIWSLGLISWEFWRWGGHYDHFNVFLFSFYSWALYNSYRSPDISKNLMFGISSGLLILFSSLAPVVVFLSLLFWGPRLIFREKKLLIVRALIPFMVFLIVSGKNYIQFGVPTTSTISGQNMMLFTALAKGISVDENERSQFVEFVYNNKYPEWWIWCFNSSMEQGSQTDLDRFIQTNYGKCCGNVTTGYSFNLLEERLKQLGEINLLSIIQKDKNTLLKKPWLFHGGVNESNTRFSIEYGKISAKVWKDFILKEPIEFGKQFLRAFRNYVWGVTFLGENKYEPQHKIRSIVVRIAGYVIAPFLLLGIMSAFYSVVASAINYVAKKNKLVMPLKNSNQKILLIMSIIFLVYSLILNTMTYSENERMFVSISPIALIIGSYYSYFIKRINNYLTSSFGEVPG